MALLQSTVYAKAFLIANSVAQAAGVAASRLDARKKGRPVGDGRLRRKNVLAYFTVRAMAVCWVSVPLVAETIMFDWPPGVVTVMFAGVL